MITIKKIIILLIVLIFIVTNVEAKTITNEDRQMVKEKVYNPKTGIINVKETIVPISIFGGCLIINNIVENKKAKK